MAVATCTARGIDLLEDPRLGDTLGIPGVIVVFVEASDLLAHGLRVHEFVPTRAAALDEDPILLTRL